jgi:hypothetical protein
MKTCKFCDHFSRTERDEEVCTKFLLYVGEDKIESPCKGFEMTMSPKKAVIVFALVIVFLFLILSQL